jgi:hypothetical protein
VEQAGFVAFIGKSLDHANAADGVFDAHVEIADPAEQLLPVLRHARAIATDQPAHDRHERHGNQRQLPVGEEHQEERADKGHHGDEQVFRPVVGDFPDVLEILGHVGDQVSGLVVVEEAEAELLHVVEGLPAHVGFHRHAEHVTKIVHDRLEPGADDVNGQEPGTGRKDQRIVRFRQQRVDHIGDRQGEGEFEKTREHGATEVENEQPRIGAIVGIKTLEH